MQGYFDAVAVEEDFTAKDNYAKQAIPTVRHTEVFEFDRADIKDANEDADKAKEDSKGGKDNIIISCGLSAAACAKSELSR